MAEETLRPPNDHHAAPHRPPDDHKPHHPHPQMDVISTSDEYEKPVEAGALKIRQTSSYMKWICAATTLISGTGSSYLLKVMNKQDSVPCENCEPRKFEGAFLQTFIMFIGESLCLLLYFGDQWLSKRSGSYSFFDFVRHPSEMDRPKGHWWWWLFPCFFDFAATVLINVAISITYASTVQMLRNFMVVVGAFLQLVLVRKALKVHEYFGVAIITVAMVLAAVPALINPEEDSSSNKSAALGIVFALVGTSSQALMLTMEDFFFRKGRYSPVKVVGLEGLYGMVYCWIAMPIADVTNFELVWQSFYQLGNSGPCIAVGLVYMLCSLVFNAFGCCTTKLATGLLRGVMFALRAPLVWLLDIIVGWIDFDWYNLAAVFVFMVGFAFYAAILRMPLFPKALWRKPLHYKCTKLELDSDYEAAGDYQKDSSEMLTATPESV